MIPKALHPWRTGRVANSEVHLLLLRLLTEPSTSELIAGFRMDPKKNRLQAPGRVTRALVSVSIGLARDFCAFKSAARPVPSPLLRARWDHHFQVC